MESLPSKLAMLYARGNRLSPVDEPTRGSVEGSLSAPLTWVGPSVADLHGLEICGVPIILTSGYHLVLAARKLMLAEAERTKDTKERELLTMLAFDIGLVDEDEVELPQALVALAERLGRRPQKDLDGAPLTVLARLVPRLESKKIWERVRALYDIGNALGGSGYANELKLEAVVGAPLVKAGQSAVPAEREAALCAISALLSQLGSGRAYPEMEKYVTLLLDSGFDAHLALLWRYETRLISGHVDAAADADVYTRFDAVRRSKSTVDLAFGADEVIGSAKKRAAESLLAMAKGRDPSVRRTKSDTPKWTVAEKRAFKARATALEA